MQYYGQVLTDTHTLRPQQPRSLSLVPTFIYTVHWQSPRYSPTEGVPERRSRVKVAVNRPSGRSWRPGGAQPWLGRVWVWTETCDAEMKRTLEPKKKKPQRKRKKGEGRSKRDFNRIWRMKPTSVPARPEMDLSETCLHACTPLSILSHGQLSACLSVSVFSRRRWLPAGWMAGAETDKYISAWVMQSTHSQNNSGRSLCWPALAAEFTVCTHTALLFVSHRTGDVFQSRVLEKKKKPCSLCAPS